MFVNLFCGACSKVLGGEEVRAASSTPSRNVAQAAGASVAQAGLLPVSRAGGSQPPQVTRAQQVLSAGQEGQVNTTQQLLAEAQALMKQLQRELDLARRVG